MNGGPKDNANPVVLSVEQSTSTRQRRRVPLGWSQIEALSADTEEWDKHYDSSSQPAPNKPLLVRTADDWAVLRALADASEATGGKGVSLLRNVGLVIPDKQTGAPHHPPFIPATVPLAVAAATTARTTALGESKESKETTTETNNRDVLDADEVFEIIRNIQDPEHPLTLEQLGVVSRQQVHVHDILDTPRAERDEFTLSTLEVRFTPTIPHCSMATLIGLSIRVKLLRSMPDRFKVLVRIEPGSHASEHAVNKQLADKERVCAALENKHLLGVVNKCIKNGMLGTS